ncbi:hypothetical protein EBY67_05850 [bacterium]|nr:hypothetical protein [bacterium]
MWLGILLPLQSMAQTEAGVSPANIPDLPSAKAATNIPEAEGASPSPDISAAVEGSTTSIPQPRPPAADPAKSGSKDWAAEAMMEKQAAAKKKQAEDMVLEDQKAKEAEVTKAKEAKEAKEKSKSDDSDLSQAAVSKGAVEGFKPMDENKLPSVTGADGVKPRAMGSGDGRVQPGFESFTGPSSTGPLGQDYQSGAKPIMPPGGGSDTRLASASKVPEAPSGGYKRLSQDPYTMPPGSEDKKKVAAQPKPNLQGKNPPAGNPLTPGAPAGYAPYDSARIVPDPRSSRRF